MTQDLARLNPQEREVLTLLAHGHTAKSIAAETGRSVAAINERLREARRKTGVGSSRELARLLALQENRDEQIGVFPANIIAAPAVSAEAAPHRRARSLIGVSAMSLIVAAALSAVVMSWSTSPAVDQTPTVEALHAELAAEPRDADWADDAQVRLDRIYAPLRGVGRTVVTCHRTLCEVAAELTPDPDSGVTEALQSNNVIALAKAAGFADQAMLQFTANKDEPAKFVTYWRANR